MVQTLVFDGVEGNHTGHDRRIKLRYSRFDESQLTVEVGDQGPTEDVLLIVEASK